jgi:anti-sigma regulatory factor (Ser/Thr protein kinase)
VRGGATFQGNLGDVPKARRLVRRALEREADPDALDMVLILVSELVTNALVHSHGGFRLSYRWTNGNLHVAVDDRSSTLPSSGPAAITATSGRGLDLVDHIASRWAAEPTAAGKSVWFDVPLPARSRPAT